MSLSNKTINTNKYDFNYNDKEKYTDNYINLVKKIPSTIISLYLTDTYIYNLLDNVLLANLLKIKIEKFNHNTDTLEKIKNSNLEEIILGISNDLGSYIIKLDVILTNLPTCLKKLTIFNTMKDNIRIKTKLIPKNLIFFQINGKKYEENKLNKIKKEQFFIFN